ncbi:hypothetical protein BJAS_P0251 [Bathymodiolus japonicus methanotrophic gill symbiont]|uniref:hypothetical protein n=1 Tax=Bathymodiolus japonicus methanotrophic gill symbiont TaxID=113269 RepID=UPI001B45E48D|nr:hypothetical protein [Bathymodiolus japonicus methanotrophic gill symbiont]GFO71041.1 hypothetical protein BJAS_P0251 [Bathymodiolus japonicus methanotrophic gill symbiont]
MATTNGSTAIRDKILASLARYRALRIGKFPCAFWRLSARPGLTAEGSSRGLILSLLFDHCLLLHPEQIARIESKLPAYTVGSLQRKSQMDVRGVAIFAKACFGHPSPSKQQKLNATTYASGGPDSSSSPRPDPTRGRNIGSK